MKSFSLKKNKFRKTLCLQRVRKIKNQKMEGRLSILGIALLLPLSGYAHNHAGEPAALPEKAMAFAQMAPLTYQPGKGLQDLQAWGESDLARLLSVMVRRIG